MIKIGSIGTAGIKQTRPQIQRMDIVCFFLPIVIFLLWFFSLADVNILNMNGLGLVSVMPPIMIAALLLMTVSFCITLQRSTYRAPLLVLHAALMLFMLYGVTPMVEQMPRFDIVYRIAGYAEFVQRTGTTNPNLDAYFSWPIFFTLAAFFNASSGLSSILSYADWSPVYFGILYFGPLYIIFSCFTTDKRIIWLSLWFFYLTNWIWQDYFSPQGFNFFLYLVMIAILVKWFKTPVNIPARPLWARISRIRFAPQVYEWLTAPDPQQTPASPGLRVALLVIFLIVFAFDVSSHQLTPFFAMMSVGGLLFCNRIRLWWLLFAMIAMTAFWILVMAHTFIVGHMSMVFGGFSLFSSLNNNVSSRVVGNFDHTLVAKLRIYMSMLIWVLAFLGALARFFNKKRDASLVILALMPFPLFIVQPYGGEMLLRSYLFSLPAMVFFTASLFYSSPIAALQQLQRLSILRRFPTVQRLRLSVFQRPAWQYAALIALNLVLISGFLFTRYGNEDDDYMTYDEFNGIQYLYSVAPDHSLFMTCWLGGPLQYKDYEMYTLDNLGNSAVTGNAIDPANVPVIVKYMQQESAGANAYLIFTRSEIATFNDTSGMPAGSMNTLETAVAKSGDFNLIYKNPDVEIFELASSAQGGQ
jgi:hypothetical protein